ncbi:MAG: hypothetical protein WC900_04420 [Oscillospiraceae bacterium]
MKKTKVLAVIAVVLAVVIGGGAAAYAFVEPFQMAVQSVVLKPESYYDKVETKSIKSGAKSFSELYSKVSNAVEGETEIGQNASIKAIFGDEIISMMGIPGIESVALNTNFSAKGELTAQNFSIDYNETTALTVNTTTDAEEGIAYVQVPEFSDAFISMNLDDLKTFLEENGLYLDDYLGGMSLPSSDSDELIKGFSLTAEELEDMINKYSNIVMEAMTEIEREKNVIGDVAGVDYKYTVLTAEVTYDQYYDMIHSFLKEMQDDEVLERLYDELMLEDAMGISYEDMLDETISSIKEQKDDPDFYKFNGDEDDFDLDDEFFTLTTYVNDDMEIVGRIFELSKDINDAEIGYITAVDGSESGTEIWLKDGKEMLFKLSGSEKEKDGAITGSYKIETIDDYGDPLEIDISIDNYKVIDEEANLAEGSFKVSTEYDGDSIELLMNLSVENQKQIIETIFNLDGEMYLTLELSFEETTVSDIKVPDGENIYDAMDEAAMEEYLLTVDVEAVTQHFTDIVGEENVEEIMYALGLEEEDYTDDYDDYNDDLYEYEYDFSNTVYTFDGEIIDFPGTVTQDMLTAVDCDMTTLEASGSEYFSSDDYTLGLTLNNDSFNEISINQAIVRNISVSQFDSGEPTHTFTIDGIGIGSTAQDVCDTFGIDYESGMDDTFISIYSLGDDWDCATIIFSDGVVWSVSMYM